MICVAELYLGLETDQLRRRDAAFDRSRSADIHEYGSLDDSVDGREAGAFGAALFFQQFVHIFLRMVMIFF